MKNICKYLFILLVLSLNTSNLAADERYLLEPPDTSSPRATLKSFITFMRDAKPILKKLRLSGVSTEIKQELWETRNRLIRCLDLSQTPERFIDNVGPESVVLLIEILDRIELPPYPAIPDVLEAKKVPRWRIPHTDITIARVEKGSRQGEYLVSPETVARLKEFYTKVRDLPYRPDAVIGKLGPAGGLYQYYFSLPGGLLPFRWIERLPTWTKSVYLDHTVWQWIAMMLTLATGAVTIILIYVLIRLWMKGRDDEGTLKSLSRLLLPLIATIIVVIVDYIIEDYIRITGKAYDVTEIALWILLLIFVMWCTFALGNVMAKLIVALPKVDPRGIYGSLIKTSCTFISITIVVIILVHGLSELGVSLIPIFTGLGVGGFALALAARPTIENLIGGLMILTDRPYRVGQRIKVKDHDGIVEQIGLRSTRVRLLTGPQLTIPNEEMAKVDIENIGRREYLKRGTSITITYDTPPDKVEKAVQIIRDILDNHEGMDSHRPPRVYFTEFNNDSLNIRMIYWYHPPKVWAYLSFCQKVNMQIMRGFNNEGIEFAFPTTTTYLAQKEEQSLHLTALKDSSLSD